MKLTAKIGLLGALLSVSACNADPGSPAENKSWVDANLVPSTSCEDSETTVRRSLLAWMNRAIDRNLESFLASAGGDCSQVDVAAAGAPTSNPSFPSSGTSTTNNQIPGVDEADFVKNDDSHAFVAANGSLHVVDISVPASAHEIAKLPLDGEPKKLLLQGDRLIAFSSMPSSEPEPPTYDPYYGAGAPAEPMQPEHECTYGRDCDFVGDGNPTRVSVFDVSDAAKPRLVRQFDLSASLISARGVGSTVHAVFYHDAYSIVDQLQLWPFNLDECGNFSPIQGTVAFEALRARNAEIIAKASVSSLMPTLTDLRLGANGASETIDVLSQCDNFFDSPLEDGSGFLTVLSFDAARSDDAATSTVGSRPGAVYATPQTLYVAVRQEEQYGQYWYATGVGWHDATVVHQFDLDSSQAASHYVASGLVKGSVLNQFSLDEWNGHLRVAASTGQSESTVSVLERDGAQLRVVGQLDGIAPGEDIRAVRFDGDRGFVVTFRNQDPLHVLDLSNPTAPAQVSELVVPGFSTYIHRLDEEHLLSIGTSANNDWSTGPVALSLFDVGDLSNPKQAFTTNIPNASASAAMTDHLAFNYFAPLGLLAVPYASCGGYASQNKSGLAVYDVDAELGFTLRGTLQVPSDGASESCSWSWEGSTSRVKRSIVSGSYIIAISDTRLMVSPLDDLAAGAADVSLL